MRAQTKAREASPATAAAETGVVATLLAEFADCAGKPGLAEMLSGQSVAL